MARQNQSYQRETCSQVSRFFMRNRANSGTQWLVQPQEVTENTWLGNFCGLECHVVY